MKKLILLAMFLGILVYSCGQSNNEMTSEQKRRNIDSLMADTKKSNPLIDSLDEVYKKLGFYNYCDAVKEDEKVLIEAYAYADAKIGMDKSHTKEYSLYLNRTYKYLQKRLLSIYNLKPDQLKKDMTLVALNGYYECGIINKEDLNEHRKKVRVRLHL